MAADAKSVPLAQMAFAFDDEEVPRSVQAENALPIPAMDKPVDTLSGSSTPLPRPRTTERSVRTRKPASLASMPSAAESQKEAERLVREGLLIRHASVARRIKLRGPLNFVDAPAEVSDVRGFDELVPAYLKKKPEGWRVTAQGFVYALERVDAAAISRLVNARRDELGVYHCVREDDGWRLVFEF